MTQFRSLFTVGVSHSYYRQNCQDFTFIFLADSERSLKNGQLLGKIHEGQLSILFAADGTGQPLVSLAGKTLRLGLKCLNPFFRNITELDFSPLLCRPLYRNSPLTPSILERVNLFVGKVLEYPVQSATRPVTVVLKDSQNQTLQTDTITDNRACVTYDLNGREDGRYTIEESGAGVLITKDYYLDSFYLDREVADLSFFGFLEITIATSFYSTPPEFTITFSAKPETLKYYLVVKNYPEADFNTLTITDTGDNPIAFNKTLADDFTDEDISADLLGDGDARIVLFTSTTTVTRQENARPKIRLQKNGEVLISHLPQPSADRPTADLIVSLSKPKS
jgi:hypothetical protein